MGYRAATLLLIAIFVAAHAGSTTKYTTDEPSTFAPVFKKISHAPNLSENKREKLILDTTVPSETLPKSPEFSRPFVNPKDVLLEELRSLDEDVSTTKIQEEMAKALKAEAQKPHEKTRVSSQKPRVRVTPNVFFGDATSPVTKKMNEDEALKALKQAELAYDEGYNEGDDDDDADDDDDDDDDDEDEDDEEEYDDDADDEDEDTIADNGDRDISEEDEVMTECPDYCRCSGQYASATTARCSKIVENQKFGAAIAHLRVENAGEISLGPQAINASGLYQLESISIVDTKLVRIDRTAFNGTKYLFSVNLTRNGLREIDADYFVNNSQLSLLTISGQPFDSHWHKSRSYILISPSIAELDFSENSIEQLPSKAFAKMPNLAFLDLKNNKLRRIERSVFEQMESLVELDLSGNLLNDIPAVVFLAKGLQILRLSSNNLTNLGIGEAPKLANLNVSKNRIKFITKEDLIGANSLEQLVVSSNGMKRIHQHAFSELDQLTHLDMSDNKLTSLNEHHLRSNARLQIILINNNPDLGSLPVFKTIGKEYETYATYRFECNNCGLDTLTEGTFDAMPALTRLYLAKNRLARLPAGLLKSMSSLRDLDLSDNMINTLEPKMFLGARSLTKLNLAGNPLVSLQITPFLQTPGLSRLDVSRCQLRRIWSEARQPLKSLRFLSVRGNELQRIALEELKATPKLSGLDASQNPFACDDEFKLAIQWLMDHGVTSTETLRYISNYAMNAEEFSHPDGVNQWSDLARLVCDYEDDGPPPRTIPHKPTDNKPAFTSPKDNELFSTRIEEPGSTILVDGPDPSFLEPIDGNLDDVWNDQEQEYGNIDLSKINIESDYSTDMFTRNIWGTVTIALIILALAIFVVAHLVRKLVKSKGHGPVIRPPMMLRQGLVDNKNCGLVYKPLQEEIPTPQMPKRGSFYSSSTFHYDKIVPESV